MKKHTPIGQHFELHRVVAGWDDDLFFETQRIEVGHERRTHENKEDGGGDESHDGELGWVAQEASEESEN